MNISDLPKCKFNEELNSNLQQIVCMIDVVASPLLKGVKNSKHSLLKQSKEFSFVNIDDDWWRLEK